MSRRLQYLANRVQLFRLFQLAFSCIFLLQMGQLAHAEPPLWPVKGVVSSCFGWRQDPLRQGKRFHAGLDIAAPQGTLIRASQRAVVAYSGSYKGYGNLVALAHGQGLYTLYSHASILYVQVGQRIEQGQVIAAVGSTGRSTGPHLHFEVHEFGKYRNPIAYLNSQQPMRTISAVSKPALSSHPLVKSQQQAIVNIATDYRKISPPRSPYTALTTVFSSENE